MPTYGTQKRKRRRRRRGGPAYVLLSLLLMTGAVLLAVSVFFKVTRIEVEGSYIYPSSSIAEASGIKEGDNLFFLKKSGAVRSIFEAFPYVEQVKLRRKLPGTIVIEITERTCVGVIPYENSYWLIDGGGILLEKTSARTVTDKPVIRGVTLLSPVAGETVALPQQETAKAVTMLELLRALADRQMTELVSEIDMTRLFDLRMTYGERLDVMLGDGTDVSVKLDFLRASVEKLAESARGTLDVSRAVDKVAHYRPVHEPASEIVSEEEEAPEGGEITGNGETPEE